jgi:hypothetical protein
VLLWDANLVESMPDTILKILSSFLPMKSSDQHAASSYTIDRDAGKRCALPGARHRERWASGTNE